MISRPPSVKYYQEMLRSLERNEMRIGEWLADIPPLGEAGDIDGIDIERILVPDYGFV